MEIFKQQGFAHSKHYTMQAFLDGVFSSAEKLEKDLEYEYSVPPEEVDETNKEGYEREHKKVCMIRQCFKDWKEFIGDDKISFRTDQMFNLKNLENAIEVYMKTDIKTINIEKYFCEDCFNETFSEEYIVNLIEIMENQEWLLPMYITPTMDELIGEREKVIGNFGGYEKLRSWTTPKYKEKYFEARSRYESVMDSLVSIYKTFN